MTDRLTSPGSSPPGVASAHPVLQLLVARSRARSRPNERSDACKLGLALEGGAMRGVVSAGMAWALEKLGLLGSFDAVYGTSAGAINGAFFVAGQTGYGTPLYWQDINNRKFINTLRLFSRAPVLSLEYLLEHVMIREKVLDWRAVVASPVPLKPVAMSLRSLRAVLLGDFETRGELFDALRASSRVPLVAGPPVEIAGHRYIDGGMIEPLSFKAAIEDGCTHVLVLPTLPEGGVRFRNPVLTEAIVTIALERLRPGLAKAYRRRREDYLADYRRLEAETREPKRQPYVFAIRLAPEDGRIHWFERRQDLLEAGARAGMEAVFRALGSAYSDAVAARASNGGDAGGGPRSPGQAP